MNGEVCVKNTLVRRPIAFQMNETVAAWVDRLFDRLQDLVAGG